MTDSHIRHPWMTLFRLPNLPTAPGDSIAGAALAAAVIGAPPRTAALAGAGISALFLYMYGLVDNDIAGVVEDRVIAPFRPLPSGAISLRAAKMARGMCWGAAFLVAALCGMPPSWWLAAGVLLAAICAYNRLKGAWLMGLCRGLSVVAGGMSVGCASSCRPAIAVALAAVGWTLYIAAVTKLSEGEEKASEGLGNRRYLLGLSAFAALPACRFLPTARLALLPAAGCFFAFAAWCAAVAPLWRAHRPEERRTAVGRAIGALLYMQIGFMLAFPSATMLGIACAIWLAARLMRRLAPEITGS